MINDLSEPYLALRTCSRLINGYSFPFDFATVHGNQTFHNVTFDDDIQMQNADVSGSIDGIDIEKFSSNIVTNIGGRIFGKKTITGNVRVNGSLKSVGKINQLDVPNDLLLYVGDQEITARKIFAHLDVGENAVHIVGDVGVVTTIDGCDLSELEMSGMSVVANETVCHFNI